MQRRAFLAVGVGLFGGCLGSGSTGTGEPEAATDQTATTTMVATPSHPDGVPTPDDDCEAGSLPEATYPSLPASLTESTVTEFAIQFEKALAHAEVERESRWTFSGFDGSGATVESRTETGYVVRTWVAVDASETGDGTRTMHRSSTSYGWYYVTDRFAARAPGEADDTQPTIGWGIVACA
ncbi:hypothetical protein [Haloarchaeobius sp. TZWWS8]|uniref:hypothetical protein n=1 Tax=Haloarchaeobius sp. TZWWS8 TaxID=3446121 RepID=UPI003EBA9343